MATFTTAIQKDPILQTSTSIKSYPLTQFNSAGNPALATTVFHLIIASITVRNGIFQSPATINITVAFSPEASSPWVLRLAVWSTLSSRWPPPPWWELLRSIPISRRKNQKLHPDFQSFLYLSVFELVLGWHLRSYPRRCRLSTQVN